MSDLKFDQILDEYVRFCMFSATPFEGTSAAATGRPG